MQDNLFSNLSTILLIATCEVISLGFSQINSHIFLELKKIEYKCKDNQNSPRWVSANQDYSTTNDQMSRIKVNL